MEYTVEMEGVDSAYGICAVGGKVLDGRSGSGRN